MKSLGAIISIAAICFGFVAGADAQQPRAEATPEQKAQPNTTETKKSKSERRAAAAKAEQALAFARQHHPELARLVSQLRKTRPAQFKSAVRHLVQSQERLERIQVRSPERYDGALEAWKLDSRIRLLAARMTMSDNPDLVAELKNVLLQRTDLRLRQLSEERDRLTARLKRIEENISRIENDPEAAAARDLKRVKKQVASKALRQPAGENQD